MNIKNCQLVDFYKVIKDKKVICFGAAKMGVEAAENCEISKNIAVYLDNDPNKAGEKIITCNGEWSIDRGCNIKNYINDNTIILITSTRTIEIEQQLNNIIGDMDIDVYDYERLKYCFTDLSSREYYDHRIIRPIKQMLVEYYQYKYQPEAVDKAVEDRLVKVNKMVDEGKMVLPAVTFMLTTRCTLNCKNCLALTPYFTGDKNYDVDADTILNDMKTFLDSVDYITRVAFLGGEPFLYKDMDVLLEYLIGNDKVESIFIPSNGTVVPEDKVIKQLRNEKVHIGLSYYGFLNEMSRIVSVFEKNNILFKVINMDEIWVRPGGIECRNKSEEQIKVDNIRCKCTVNSRIMENGRLYCCGRSARLHALKVTDSHTDYQEIDDKMTVEERRDRINKVFMADYAEACNYCDFGGAAQIKVKSGEQMNEREISSYLVCSQDEYMQLKRKAELYDIFSKKE